MDFVFPLKNLAEIISLKPVLDSHVYITNKGD